MSDLDIAGWCYGTEVIRLAVSDGCRKSRVVSILEWLIGISVQPMHFALTVKFELNERKRLRTTQLSQNWGGFGNMSQIHLNLFSPLARPPEWREGIDMGSVSTLVCSLIPSCK